MLAASMSLNLLVLAALRSLLEVPAAPMNPLALAALRNPPVPAVLRSLLEVPVVPTSLLEESAAPALQPA
jgi:hypothetical protein